VIPVGQARVRLSRPSTSVDLDAGIGQPSPTIDRPNRFNENMNRIPLTEFVSLGQRLCLLLNPQATDVQTIADEISGFMRSLTACGLRRTYVAAEPLDTIARIPGVRSGRPTPIAAAQLRAYMEPVRSTLYSEAGEIQLAAINTGVVSKELRDLPSRLKLNDTQSHLLQEAILCLESGAYRAASVMAWNLAYDYVRQWVFDNRLSAFNQVLTKRYLDRNGQPVFVAVGNYQDFFAGKPDERTVIETCYIAQIVGEKLRDNLRYYLRRRNDYAHRSFTTPSAEQTNAYVKDLIDVLWAPPFT
jgi:hypothetical protein